MRSSRVLAVEGDNIQESFLALATMCQDAGRPETMPRDHLIPAVAVVAAAALATVGLDCGGDSASDASSSATGGSDAAAGASGADATGNPTGECSPTQPCAADELCHYTDQQCGTGNELGVCSPRVQPCDDATPVCSCGGNVEASACSAFALGLDLDLSGACTAPAGSFRCGPAFCTAGSQYCQVWLTDMMGFADSFSCKAVPASCGVAPTCACLPSCGGFACQADASGNLTVTCPGG